jgi:phenylpropionate dioxygenase-like ring-hydroxylating dioxygenase large terminal subunit
VSDRFPFPRPYGWFSVGRLDELPEASVSPLRVQGTDLVLWRDDGCSAGAGPADVAWRLFDAYCPHLRAHLGVGGRVGGGCLVCPFHEWSFDAGGANVGIPYAEPAAAAPSGTAQG